MAFSDFLPRRQTESKLPLTAYPMFDRMVENFFNDMTPAPYGFGSTLTAFRPQIEMNESEKEINITVELPGMKEEDTDFSVLYIFKKLSRPGGWRSETND